MSSRAYSSPNKVKKLRIIELIDNFILGLGSGISWLSFALVCVILVQVILRYVFSSGLVVLEELQWYLYAIVVMNAVAYGVSDDIHISMDLFYQKFSIRTQIIINLFGLIFFALPISLIFFVKGIEYTQASFAVGESSPSPEGLPCLWLIKAVMPISMFLYSLAVTSRIVHLFTCLFKKSGE